MKILLTVAYYYPLIGGAEEVVRQISEGLAKRGHEITVATSYVPERSFEELSGVKIVSFNIAGNKVKGISGETNKYKNYLINSNFDLVCNYAAQSWTTDLTLDIFDKINAAKVLIPCGYSGLALWSKRPFYWNYFRKLPAYLKKYDHIIYHSYNYLDKHFGDKHGIVNYSVIPNGVSEEEIASTNNNFRKEFGIETPYMILNVSNHYKLKNHKFTLSVFRKLNRNDVTLVIIGSRVSGYRGCYRHCSRFVHRYGKRIRLIENIPRKHVISAFHQADIFVFGSRIEYFPLVLLEAMATRTPFISTDIGNVRELRGGIVVSSQEEMAYRINELLSNDDKRMQLGQIGFETCIKNYLWDTIIQQYENLFLKLVMNAHGKN